MRLNEAEKERIKSVLVQGWQCPRCGKVWSPLKLACQCKPALGTKERGWWDQYWNDEYKGK